MRKLILSLLPMLGLIAGACGGKTDAKTIDMKSESASTGATALNENPADTSSVKVAVKTTEGDFEILLYGDTPKHRDNFVKLVKENYYDGTLFHRVINEFMVQAGDPESRNAPAGKHLGAGGPGYQIDAEFVYPARFHKRGALAAARTGDQMNPERKSSGSQFYVVTGKTYTPAELDQMEQQMIQQQFYSLAQKRRDDIMRMQKPTTKPDSTHCKKNSLHRPPNCPNSPRSSAKPTLLSAAHPSSTPSTQCSAKSSPAWTPLKRSRKPGQTAATVLHPTSRSCR